MDQKIIVLRNVSKYRFTFNKNNDSKYSDIFCIFDIISKMKKTDYYCLVNFA